MRVDQMRKMAGVNRATIYRWISGEVKPDWIPVRTLAWALWPRYPDQARELVEASGWPWQEPPEEDLPPPERLSDQTKAAIRRDLADDPVLAEQVIAYTEGLASGRIPPAAATPAADPQAGGGRRRRAQG